MTWILVESRPAGVPLSLTLPRHPLPLSQRLLCTMDALLDTQHLHEVLLSLTPLPSSSCRPF